MGTLSLLEKRGIKHRSTRSEIKTTPRVIKVAPVVPGTQLKKICGWFGIYPTSGCGCSDQANLMNKKGVEWCIKNIDKITDSIAREKANRNLTCFWILYAPIYNYYRRVDNYIFKHIAKSLVRLSIWLACRQKGYKMIKFVVLIPFIIAAFYQFDGKEETLAQWHLVIPLVLISWLLIKAQNSLGQK